MRSFVKIKPSRNGRTALSFTDDMYFDMPVVILMKIKHITSICCCYKYSILCWVCTVNSEIFARVIFSRNFAYAKFRENKTLAK